MNEMSRHLSEKQKLEKAREALKRIRTFGLELTKNEIMEIVNEALDITVPESPLIRFTL